MFYALHFYIFTPAQNFYDSINTKQIIFVKDQIFFVKKIYI